MSEKEPDTTKPELGSPDWTVPNYVPILRRDQLVDAQKAFARLRDHIRSVMRQGNSTDLHREKR